jgi:peptidylprolyl isomerase
LHIATYARGPGKAKLTADSFFFSRYRRRRLATSSGSAAMTFSVRALAVVGLLLCALVPARAADPENTLYLDVPKGRVVIELRPDVAPLTVAHVKALVRRHFYDGLTFHRVIDGFMAQTGDPKGDGTGGSGETVKAEFSRINFVRGTVGLARSQSRDSGDSQFFICFAPASFLDGNYTAFGQVVSGMDAIDAIKKGNKDDNGRVTNPDRIVRMQVAADADKAGK